MTKTQRQAKIRRLRGKIAICQAVPRSRLRLWEAQAYAVSSGLRPAPAKEPHPQAVHLIPLSHEDKITAESAAKCADRRKSNWRSARPAPYSVARGSYLTESFEYRGNYKNWPGSEYFPQMRSCCRISRDGALLTALLGFKEDEQVLHIPARHGYRWEVDANGPRLVRKRDGADFHPDSGDIRAGWKQLVGKLRENAEIRLELRRTARREAKILREARKGGVWVCFLDSVKAGNCGVGTHAFARRNGLALEGHHPVKTLPAGATQEERRRIALAVLVATRRQAKELAEGVCWLGSKVIWH